jgi:hypothetical protein
MPTQPFCRENLTLKLTSISRAVAACSFAFAAFAPSSQAAPNKAEIDSFARANGFPSSDYPYYENVNGCGGEGWSKTAVRDTWGRVSFREACNNHDRCYMTPGSDVNQCDNRFGFDLRVSCERDSYVRDPVFNKKIPDPVTLSACYPIATTYFGSVRAIGWNWHQAAQAKARRYRDLVQIISTSDLTSGYFRQNDRPEVYFVNAGTRTSCHVQNPSQMDVYGGFSQVKIVSGDAFRNGTQLTGPCLWPDGLYKSNDRAEVYYLYDNWKSACWVRTPQRVVQLGGWSRVRIVSQTPRESFIVGRSYSESC